MDILISTGKIMTTTFSPFQFVFIVCDEDPATNPPLRLPDHHDPGQPQRRPGRFPRLWKAGFHISSQVLLRQQPGTPSPNNTSYASVTELGITENELEHHKMMKVDHGIVEADLGPADPGPVLLPEPTNTDHMIR